MELKSELTRPERKKGQKFALLANMFANVGTYVMTGALMMLYAGDVLGLPTARISQILALIPLVSLIRFLFLRQLSGLGKVRLLRISAFLKGLAVLSLILIPSGQISYHLYLGLLIAYSLIAQMGTGTAWHPLLRDITTDGDRGRFFSRMRLVFTLINLTITGLVPLIIGEAVSSLEYKLFLVLPLLAQIDMFFMVKQVPEIHAVQVARQKQNPGTVWKELKRLARPLLIIILVQCSFFPLFVLYLRQGLMLPSNLVARVVFVGTLGNAFSLLFWGEISDTVGFRNMMAGVHLLGVLQIPFLLLVLPGGSGMVLPVTALLGLFLYSFLDGFILAGSGIAMTSIQHHFSSRETSMLVFSLYAAVTLLINAFWIYLTGRVIDRYQMPLTLPAVLTDHLYLDGVKVFMICFSILARSLLFLLVRGLPNLRPWFGLGDFFTALNPLSLRTLVQSGRLSRLDGRSREMMSHSLGYRGNPFSIHSQAALLKDPSYDVKVSAIRELGRTGSPLAGRTLHPLLEKPNMAIYHEHVIWALGQLEWEPAAPDLVAFLTSDRSEKLKAASARALGRIGTGGAVPVLRELIGCPTPTFHLSSSACWALIRLDPAGSADLIFQALPRYRDSNIRYEVMDALCPHLGISNSWILKYGQDQGAWQALLEQTEEQSPRWRRDHDEVITALSEQDFSRIRTLYAGFPGSGAGMGAVLRSCLAEQDCWNPLFLLASAQMLLGD